MFQEKSDFVKTVINLNFPGLKLDFYVTVTFKVTDPTRNYTKLNFIHFFPKNADNLSKTARESEN